MNKKQSPQHAKVVNFEKSRCKVKPTLDISLLEMLFDNEKRQAIFDYYDEKHEETAEENEIFMAMRDKPYPTK